MRDRLLLIGAFTALVLPGVIALSWLGVTRTETVRFDTSLIPDEVSGWRTTAETRLDSAAEAMLRPEEYIWRRYERANGTALWLYAAFYSQVGSSGQNAHDPAACYPAQGWEIVGQKTLEIAVADGASLRSQLLHAEKLGRQEAIISWFQPADRWPRSNSAEQLFRVWDALRGRPEFAFVRLSMPIPRLSHERTPQALLELASELAPRIRGVLDGDHAPGLGRTPDD